MKLKDIPTFLGKSIRERFVVEEEIPLKEEIGDAVLVKCNSVSLVG